MAEEVPPSLWSGSLTTMRPLEVPQGTTLRSAIFDLFPREHAIRVPPTANGPKYRAVLKIKGKGGGIFTIAVDGTVAVVTEGDSPKRDLWLLTDTESFQTVMEDAMGPHLIVPHTMQEGAAAEIVTDPRLIARVLLTNGSVLASLTGVPGGQRRLWVAMGCGRRAIAHIDEHETDATIEVPYDIYRAIVAGQLSPSEAREAGKLKITGNLMLVMQLGLAGALLMPTR